MYHILIYRLFANDDTT